MTQSRRVREPMVANGVGPVAMASDGLPVMSTMPGFLIRRAHQLHASLWLRQVGPSLTSVQFAVLLALFQQRQMDQSAIAEVVSLDKNTAADVLRRLRSRAYITRERDREDGRRMMTRLTATGTAMLHRASPKVSQLQDRLLSVVSTEERHTVLNLMRLIAYHGEPPDIELPTAHEATLRLGTAPGHLIRRSQQLHTLYWSDEVSDDLTSPQFTVLLVLCREPEISQALLGEQACLDKATCADVVSRLYRRGLVDRSRDDTDGRRHKLTLSERGRSVLVSRVGGVRVVQERLTAPLSAKETHDFNTIMTKIVSASPTESPRPNRGTHLAGTGLALAP